MERIRSQFFSGVSVQEMNLRQVLKDEFLDWDRQTVFLTSTVLDPQILKHPPKWSYQIAFLKQCITILEAMEAEIRDEFYQTLVQLQSHDKESQKWVFKHYVLPNGEMVTIKETPQIISEGTTGLTCWQAGIFLADWMSTNLEIFRGKRILELGSGTGLTGLIASRVCEPQQIILSDCHDHVLSLLRENVALNGCPDSVKVVDLDWVSPSTTLDDHQIDPEIILAADVVYDDTIFRPLVDVLSIFLSRNNAVRIYLAATVRNEETLQRFLDLAGDRGGLCCTEVSSSKRVKNTLNWDEKTEIKLFEIKRKEGLRE